MHRVSSQAIRSRMLVSLLASLARGVATNVTSNSVPNAKHHIETACVFVCNAPIPFMKTRHACLINVPDAQWGL